jgi:hypothetical protein
VTLSSVSISLPLACGAPEKIGAMARAATSSSGSEGPRSEAPRSDGARTAPPASGLRGTSGTSGTSRKPPPDAAAIFARLKPGLVACYEQGKKATPTMLDGKLRLNASIDAAGKTTCVIPSHDTGLTHEVEDCMSARFAAETFDGGAPWSTSVPVVLRAGALSLDTRAPEAAGIESLETYRMPDAFEVLESLVPELEGCIRGVDRSSGLRSVLVGARVGADGRTQCALASTSGTLPPEVGDCSAGVLRAAKFPAPKGGSGLVLVPITLVGGSGR